MLRLHSDDLGSPGSTSRIQIGHDHATNEP